MFNGKKIADIVMENTFLKQKVLDLEKEVQDLQVDMNIVFETPLIFEILIDHPYYGNDFVAAQWIYKSMRDFVSGSNLGFYIPSFGGTRLDAGVNSGIVILPFSYDKPKEIPLNCNARVIARSVDDSVQDGQYSTVTLYIEKVKL